MEIISNQSSCFLLLTANWPRGNAMPDSPEFNSIEFPHRLLSLKQCAFAFSERPDRVACEKWIDHHPVSRLCLMTILQSPVHTPIRPTWPSEKTRWPYWSDHELHGQQNLLCNSVHDTKQGSRDWSPTLRLSCEFSSCRGMSGLSVHKFWSSELANPEPSSKSAVRMFQ